MRAGIPVGPTRSMPGKSCPSASDAPGAQRNADEAAIATEEQQPQ